MKMSGSAVAGVLLFFAFLFASKKSNGSTNELVDGGSGSLLPNGSYGLNPFVMQWFDISEFDSKGSGEEGTGVYMQTSTLRMANLGRTLSGVPWIINSGYRTKSHNSNVGGVIHSSHTLGYAFDVSFTPDTKDKILKGLRDAGFKRIGHYNTFFHADNDPNKPQVEFIGKP